MLLENRRIALIEDDPIMGESLVQRLELEGAAVAWWRSATEALHGLPTSAADAVICDIRLPDGSGEDVYRKTSQTGRHHPFLFITGYGDVSQAVRLMRQGAHDYVTKPFEMSEFLDRLHQILGPGQTDADPVLGLSRAMREAQAFLARAARVASPLLVTGETGVGKEVVTRYLHALRAKPSGPFMAVNCAALPPDLMESELFGHERGAFTGAQAQHLGYAERAGNGILFLDEIGDLAPKLQGKLLRLIEDRSFHRVGGERAIPFKARLVCATNTDLETKVATGAFREDLYYRINVLSLPIPPLRDRNADIVWLMDRFYIDLAAGMETEARGFSAAAYIAASAHAWPGNVRELRNRIERALALCEQDWITPADLFPERASDAAIGATAGPSLAEAREATERWVIIAALDEAGRDVERAADRLQVSRSTLFAKIRKLGIRT